MLSCIMESKPKVHCMYTNNCKETMMVDNVITFENVSFRYSEDGPWVLKNCSFTVRKNESVAIIGHNGSGKSTIAKLMNGLLFPEEGTITVNGKALSEKTVWDIRKDIGMVFQNPDNQFVGATVQDDVAFGLENRGIERPVMMKRIDEALSVVRMSEYMYTEPHRLSGGQKQRVAIAGVIAIIPKVLILDEATVMLDPKGRLEIMETIQKLQEEMDVSLIAITHDLNEILKVEKIIVLNKGEIWDVGTPREIISKGSELRKIGLDIPFITELSNDMKDLGIRLQKEPLSIEEMLEELWILQLKK